MLLKGNRAREPILPKIGGDNLLPLSMMIMACSTMMLALGFLWQGAKLARIANNEHPTLVQSSAGKAFIALPQAYDYRSPQLLQNTARDWAVLMFSWGETASNVVSGSIDLTDHESGKIPLSAYKASMLLSDDFRDRFLSTYTSEIFTPEAAQGALSSLYVPLQVLPPKEISTGRWEVEVLGSRYISTPQNPAGKMAPANFRVEMIAAEIPQSPLEEDASASVKAVYQLFESGIRITKVEELPHASR
ncbi:MAG: hypothetical protein HLUCCA11_20360 [Phormidesmis priestleyi Ana]|uniref:Uncharacterized protein n=1 Tax=Phormidesmis priestleyi Ana TaxID=1666911 RepID=A0A0P7ZDY7_9CYAN|nr:MAG: hypothetical protein HLUCCA11_20360 [Phormidesmis priestleyi Ana]